MRYKDNSVYVSSKYYKMVDWGSVESELNDTVNPWSLTNREYRTLYEAQFFSNNRNLSVRQIAENIGVAHMTVWRDIVFVLPRLSTSLYSDLHSVLVAHKSWSYAYARKMEEKAKKR